MKKTLLTLLVLAGIGSANTATAQIADGSVAPDFTVVDISGTTHNLYDYLDQGKTVVIDLFATWCSPCWNYALGGAMDDAYAAYGPAGTNEMVFLSIESDGSTTAADLAGTGSNTTGNWVNQIPNPLIDDNSVAGLYNLAYYPTIFMICPNRIVTEVGQISSGAGFNTANNSGCANTIANGTNNGAIIGYTGETSSCSAMDVTINLQNMGSANLTAATIEVMDGASSVASLNWTGNLATYEVASVTVGQVTPSAATNYTIEITSADDNPVDNSINQTLSPADQAAGLDISIEIKTDAYGSETTWELRGSTGTLIASGGPYNDLSAAGTTVQPAVNVTLTTPFDCTTFTIDDSYGDGMDSGYGAGGYAVKDHNGATLVSGGVFTDTDAGKFAAGNNVSINENAIDGLGVYPNPFTTTAAVNFNNNTGLDAIIEVMNMLGQVVYTENAGNAAGMQNVTIDGSSFDAGIYMVNVKTGAVITSKRIVLTK
jgi:hypothetical protein